MGPISYALSVGHFINSVGADAGFAAIIGLAILVLLYFAQARETSHLREQAYEAGQRVQQLEARLSSLGRQQAAAASRAAAPAAPAAARPESRTVAPAVAAPAAAPAPVPVGAPAGVGAPALTAATRLIPEAPVAASAPGGDITTLEPPPSPGDVPAPAPATVAGGANGTAHPVAAPPENAFPPRSAPRQAPPRVQMRPPTAAGSAGRRPPAPPRGSTPAGSSPLRRRVVGVVLVALAAGVVIAGLLLATSGGGSSNNTASNSSGANSNAPTTSVRRRHGAAGGVTPSSVTIAVLNGTASSGLAHRVSLKLGRSGYRQGTVATATDQTRTATVVAYMPGHRREAQAVASSLNLGPASIAPVDTNTQAVACPPPAACNADVVVTVGTDLANTQ